VHDECDHLFLLLSIYFATDNAGLTQLQDVLYIVLQLKLMHCCVLHNHTCRHNTILALTIQVSFAEYIPIPINAML